MRKLILVVACLSLFLAGWCFGQENVLNGTLWKSLTSVEKLLFVTGFDKGRTVGMNEGINKALDVVVAVKPSWTAEEKRKLVEKAKQIDQKSNANSDVTRSQLLTTVSTFYDDYRNMPICLGDAVQLSTLSLKGNTPTEQKLDTARKSGAEHGCQ